MEAQIPDIYDCLDPILKRPSMYFKCDSISDLERFLSAFELGFASISNCLDKKPLCTMLMFHEYVKTFLGIELGNNIFQFLSATSNTEMEAVERFCQIYRDFRADIELEK